MKIMISVIAVVLGLAGLLMTGCGAVFTFSAGGGMGGILIISVPSLLAGLAMLYGAWRLVRSQFPREIPQEIPKE